MALKRRHMDLNESHEDQPFNEVNLGYRYYLLIHGERGESEWEWKYRYHKPLDSFLLGSHDSETSNN
jgi:hypothetical protein